MNTFRDFFWAGKLRKTVTIVVGVLVVLGIIGSVLPSTEEPAPTVAPAGWTDEQHTRFKVTYIAGEELLFSELLPGLAADVKRTPDAEIDCYIKTLEATYPGDADKIIAGLWVDEPDDTPGVKDSISDTLYEAMVKC